MGDDARRALQGGAWLAMANLLQLAVRILSIPITARLIAPQDFGLMGMAMVSVTFAMVFNDLGLSSALIRHERPSESLWASAFWINAVVGGVLTVLLVVISPWIAELYAAPAVTEICQVTAIILFLHCLQIVPSARLRRDMKFKSVAVVEALSTTVSAVVCIVLAFMGYGIWSLVGQQIVLYAARLVGLVVLSRFVPAFAFNWAETRPLAAYSLNVFWSDFVSVIADRADKAIIGRLSGAQALGYYGQGFQTIQLPVQTIGWSMGGTLLPLFARLHADKARLPQAVLSSMRSVNLVMAPLAAGAAALSAPLVGVILGRGASWDWAPVAPILAALSPVLVVRCLGIVQTAALQTIGRTDLLLQRTILSAILSLLGLAFGTPFGLAWSAAGFSAGYALGFALTSPAVAHAIGLEPAGWARAMITAPALAAVMGLAVWVCDQQLAASGWPDVMRLIAGCGAGAVIYSALTAVFDLKSLRGGWAMVNIAVRRNAA